MEQDARIYVAGQQTLIGAALIRELKRQGFTQVIHDPAAGLDLTDPVCVDAWFREVVPAYVFVAAGKSGGIEANQRSPAELIRDNLLVACHLIHGAYRHGVKKLLYLASSCSYPKSCAQPMKVESLLTGALEPTNEAYAMAKLAGIKLCQAYRRQYGIHGIIGIPGDPFGPGDDFDLTTSHVIGALMRKMHDAKERRAPTVEVWGTGSPRRGFIFVDDLANACVFLMNAYDGFEPINIGSGWDLSIRDVALLIKTVVGYEGQLRFNPAKPDGMPVKLLDCTQIMAMGWRPQATIQSALSATYEWFVTAQHGTKAEACDISALC